MLSYIWILDSMYFQFAIRNPKSAMLFRLALPPSLCYHISSFFDLGTNTKILGT